MSKDNLQLLGMDIFILRLCLKSTQKRSAPDFFLTKTTQKLKGDLLILIMPLSRRSSTIVRNYSHSDHANLWANARIFSSFKFILT